MTALATISRTCEAGGCTNPVTGRSDKRTCSAACKKAVQRARLDEDDFVRALKVPPNDAYYLFVRDEKRDERRELSERATAACRCGDRRIVDRVDGHCAKCGHVPHGFDLLWRTAPTYSTPRLSRLTRPARLSAAGACLLTRGGFAWTGEA